MYNKLDFKKINTLALERAEDVVSHFAPHGKLNGHEWIALNPNRDDRNARSFSINLNTGVWADFATYDKGGDVISYVAYVLRASQTNACKIIARFLGESVDAVTTLASPDHAAPTQKAKRKEPVFTPISPPPEAAESCPLSHPTLGKATNKWDYKSATGGLLKRICRFDRVGVNGERIKEYRPFTYGTVIFKSGKSRTGWHSLQLPNNRPLYGLDRLAAFPTDLPVIFHEGEKPCDAGTDVLFSDYPNMTWSGGSNAIHKTNFSDVKGREAWCWQDNDEAGEKSLKILIEALLDAGATAVRIIDISLFDRYAPGPDGELLPAQTMWPHKADAYDAVQMGWTQQHIKTLIQRDLLLVPLDVGNKVKELHKP